MGDILIIGGGFSGLEAARILSRNRLRLNTRRILLVDKKRTFDFSPILPDVIGRRIRQENSCLDLADYLEKLNINFQQDEVVRVGTTAKEVILKSGSILAYEFLIISCGTVTDFYGSKEIERNSFKLDTADDAVVIQSVVSTYPAKKIFVAGGGRRGVEAASNAALLLRRKKIKKYSVNIVESSEDILDLWPQWIKDYCRLNLCGLRINVYPECSVKEAGNNRIKFTNGMEFENYLLIWTVGLKTPSFVQELKFDKDEQGRLLVDKHMMFDRHCFAIGSAAAFKSKDKILREALGFSISQARVAAKNILRIISGKKNLAGYRPQDAEHLISLANRKAVGYIFFFRVYGILGWIYYYLRCIFRAASLKNKFGIFCDVFLK